MTGRRDRPRDRPRRRSQRVVPVPTSEFEVSVATLGARGDGIAETAHGRVYVADGLPGERVRVRLVSRRGDGFAATIVARLSAAAARVIPGCPHFAACGGCAVQHLDAAAYADWKQGLVVGALALHGLDPAVIAPLRRVAAASRRRAKLAAQRGPDGTVVIGFRGRASHRVADAPGCLVLRPALLDVIAALRGVLASVVRPGETHELLLTETETGPDLVVTAPRPAGTDDIAALAGFADARDLARVCWVDGSDMAATAEPVAQRRPAVVTLGGVAVALPPGAFLQASGAAEAILAATVGEAIGDVWPVADLFAGCGTFTFALARRDGAVRVHAVDGNPAGIQALQAAAGAAGLGGRVSAASRDLARQPLAAGELDRFAAVVFDPPRAGAPDQASQLARSRVPIVVVVSCNPATFARDARILVDGGYRLDRVVPVDQFVFSHQVELAAVFRR